MVVVHSGKRKVCVRVCASLPVTVWLHAEVYEFLCLLNGFVDFFNCVFMFQVT